MKVLAAGIPEEGLSLLEQVSDKVFGGACDVEELSKENARVSIRKALSDVSVVLVVLDFEYTELCRSAGESMYHTDRFYLYDNIEGLCIFLEKKYGLTIVDEQGYSKEDIADEVESEEGFRGSVGISEQSIEEVARLNDIDDSVVVNADEESMAGIEDTSESSIPASKVEEEIICSVTKGSSIVNADSYIAQLKEKDSIIKTLNLRIREYEDNPELSIAESSGVSKEEFSSVMEQNRNLNAENSSLKEQNRSIKEEISSLKDLSSRTIHELNVALKDAEEKISRLDSNLDDSKDELSNERVLSSQQAAVLADKEKEIARLKVLIEEADEKALLTQGMKKEVDDLRSELNTVKEAAETQSKELLLKGNNLSDKVKEVGLLKAEIAKLRSENDNALSSIESYKGKLSEAEKKLQKAEEQASSADERFSEVNSRTEELMGEISVLKDKLSAKNESISKLQTMADEKDKLLLEANAEKIRLENKVRVLDVDDGESAAEELTTELGRLRMQLAEMNLNVFHVLSTKSKAKDCVKAPLIKGIVETFKNIRFQFSGNAESKRGTYKCMLNEFKGMPDEKFVIVDISSETAIDYVFEMHGVVDGLSWFSVGGPIEKYLSNTSLPNVAVLSPAIGYVNDGYFLTVDWVRRLRDLENSGYRVVLFGGDISNLVGRVLFEAFSDLGNTAVYVKGNALGSRSVVANSAGLKGISKSLVVYFDFDKAMSKFYDMMKQHCECRILSYARD